MTCGRAARPPSALPSCFLHQFSHTHDALCICEGHLQGASGLPATHDVTGYAGQWCACIASSAFCVQSRALPPAGCLWRQAMWTGVRVCACSLGALVASLLQQHVCCRNGQVMLRVGE